MKKFECYDCDVEFKAETREQMLNMLYAHYMSEHKEIITGANEAEKKDWMAKFDKDWSESPELE